MAIASKVLTRVFKYQSLTLPDPGPDKTPEQVKAMYSGPYPELATAVVEGPQTKGDTSTYTFTRAVGTKGAGHIQALRAIARGEPKVESNPLNGATVSQIEEAKACSKIAQAITSQPLASTPITPPASAFSLYG